MNTRLAAILARPIAHRGLHDRHLGIVENSFEAADAAIAAGFGIECDIRLSGDGEAVVFHDDDLDRLTALSGPVAARSAAELSAIPLRNGQGTIPLLSEFLARIGGRVPLVVEIKSRGDGDLRLADQALEAVAGYGGAIALKSFDPLVMERCRCHGAPLPPGPHRPLAGSRAERRPSRL